MLRQSSFTCSPIVSLAATALLTLTAGARAAEVVPDAPSHAPAASEQASLTPPPATTPAPQAPTQATPTPPAAPSAPATAPRGPVPERAFVVLDTSKGAIVLELNGAKAPLSVENFLRYTEEGFYDGTIFHRVIGTFMIQGGGFDSAGTQKPTHSPIKNESSNGLKNEVGTIAFARTQNPDSATAQFFINVGDNSGLKDAAGAGYAVFGKVIGGMDTVEAIKAVKTGRRTLMARSGNRTQPMPSGDVPLEVVEIKSARRVTEEQAMQRVAELTKAAAEAAKAKAQEAAAAAGATKGAPGGTGTTPPRPPTGGSPPAAPPGR